MTREEAIKELRGFIGQLTEGCQEAMEVLIPELAESEDEKIRKGLIDIFNTALGQDFLQRKAGLNEKEVIAYLEKQKEQKPTNAVEGTYAVTTVGHIAFFTDKPIKDLCFGDKVKIVIVKED